MTQGDPRSELSLFVIRRIAADRVAVGAGLLISPSLALTALHVVCDTGADLVVPPSARIDKLMVQRKIGGNGQDNLFDGRLIWPPPGAPARSGGFDVALIALDNKVIPAGIEPLAPGSVSRWTSVCTRFNLAAACGRVTLGLDDAIALRPELTLHSERRWTFSGYPAAARDMRVQALAALGKSTALEAPRPRTAEVSSLTPDPLTGYIGAASAPIAPRAEPASDENPLAGTSGAALYALRNVGGVMRIFVAGVASRAQRGETDDQLSFAPIPPRDGASDVGPDAAACKAFWDIVAADQIVTRGALQRAMEELPFLDRRREVRKYLKSYDSAFGAYVYGFACTSYDLHGLLFKRLQNESCRPSEDGLAALFDKERLSDQRRIRALREKDGDDSWPRALKDIAAAIRADPEAGGERLDAIARRLASGVHPRVLQFAVYPHEVFDAGRVTDWGRDTLNALLQSLAQWAQARVAPAAGQANFSAPNPLVALLAFVDNVDEMRPLPDVRHWLGAARELFNGGLTPPDNVSCAFFERPLDVIDYGDFEEWFGACVGRDNTDDALGRIARRVETPFQTEGHSCRKFRISQAIDALLFGRSS